MEDGNLLVEGPTALARASDTNGQASLLDWLNAQGESIDPERRDVVIERALDLLLANYLDLEAAERAAADVRERAGRGEYSSLTSPARLAELVGRHLAEATGDRHVQVKFGAGRVPDPFASADETAEELAQLRRDAEAENFGIGETRVLSGNVGYLPFTRFFRAEFAGDALAAAMEDLATTDALIIDLRESRGGDPVMAVLAASWFFDGRPRHWNDMVRRYDGTTTQFWTAAWLPGPRYVGKPIYVLTADRTFSAPESFAYELQQTGRATIVGEVTGGGAHPGAWFPIDDRFALFIPLSRYVSAVSGGDWEGTGVEPDVECAAAEALDCAHRLALETLGREEAPADNPPVRSASSEVAEPIADAPTANELLALDRQANEAFLKGDAAFFEGLLSDQFVMLGPGGARVDKVTTTGMIAGVRCDVKDGWTLDEPHLATIDADTYVLTYRGTFDGTCTMDGRTEKAPSPVRAATVWVRSGEKWLAAFHGENPIFDPRVTEAPPAEPAARREAPNEDDEAAQDAGPSASAADPSTDEMVAIETSVWEAWKARDAKTLEELTARDLAFVDIFGNVTSGKTETITFWTEHQCDVQSVRVADGAVTSLSGTVGILTFKGILEGTCGGQEFPLIYGTSVYTRNGDAWKLAFTMNQLAN
ncbi:MAG TPA: DUF4440 domain-containing protein [Gemmatimonadota bacterium]|nr:DUF4440 domain-containing protein [Gemmatimonadota bacterium]